MEQHKSFFKKKDYGKIKFGKFKGKKWNDPDVNIHYLEWLISDDCLTNDENKKIARAELAQRKMCDGQIEDDRLKS